MKIIIDVVVNSNEDAKFRYESEHIPRIGETISFIQKTYTVLAADHWLRETRLLNNIITHKLITLKVEEKD